MHEVNPTQALPCEGPMHMKTLCLACVGAPGCLPAWERQRKRLGLFAVIVIKYLGGGVYNEEFAWPCALEGGKMPAETANQSPTTKLLI